MSCAWRIVTDAHDPVRIWLGLGSNVGDRGSNLSLALNRISRIVELEAVSQVYETEPVGKTDQPRFWNLVTRAATRLPAADLLTMLKQIETDLGRVPGERWGPRPIDVDILLYGTHIIDVPGLTIPHPRMKTRAFVLRPLMDLDADLTDPRSGRRFADVLGAGSFEETRRLFDGRELMSASP